MKITLRPSLTADGYLANLEGECYSWINPKDEQRYIDAVTACGCEIVGRKTYDQYRDDFLTRTDITTFVYTNRASYEDTDKIKFIGGTAEELVRQIENHGFNDVIVSGGGELNGLLASENLLDEIHLSVHPVTLGQGIKLFGSYDIRLELELIDVNTEIDGVIQSIYRVVK